MLRAFPPTMAAEDIFHVRGISFNSLVALSPIGMARDAIGVAMGLEQQTARWVGNGARPSVVLQSKKPLNEPTAKRLKKQWEDNHAGLQNVGRTVVLEDGIEAKQLQLTSEDIEMIEQRNFQLGDIARFYRVPPHKLGTEQMRGVNLVQMDQDYVSNTIMPDLERWEQKFEKDFDLDAAGLEVDMDETALLRADITTRFNAARIGMLTGFLSPNEVRAGENLAPVEGGDQVFRPLNMAALGSDATGTAPDGAGRPAQGELPADATDGAEPPEDDKALHRVLARRAGVSVHTVRRTLRAGKSARRSLLGASMLLS
jgi:HK97 family phage portal protein